MKTIISITYPVLALFAFACFALSLLAQAPAADYGGRTVDTFSCVDDCDDLDLNTAQGYGALFNNQGQDNTGFGALTLAYNTANDNTAVGYAALFSNTTGNNNNAFGYGALGNNETGPYNNAFGNGALSANTTGDRNTAMGEGAMILSTTGSQNTALGVSALRNNTTGFGNIAIGQDACNNNGSASFNTGVGWKALISNNASANTATGIAALFSNTSGNSNTASGSLALLYNTTGSSNVGIGVNAGRDLTTGSGNICIGAGVNGVAGESNTTRIRNIYSSVASGRAVYINSDNKIGTLASTRRVKENIKPMDRASEAILALKPVSFRYKKEIDASGTSQFGLIAEDVAETDPELVTRDAQGKPETVRYEAVNAMLLNEFLKEHRKNEEQQATIAMLKSTDAKQEAIIAKQQKQIEALTAGLQRVSAQLELNKPAPQTALNNR